VKPNLDLVGIREITRDKYSIEPAPIHFSRDGPFLYVGFRSLV
jgi:hypothetical protein